MGPEIIIESIELLYWNLYQFDINIWENQKERFFIRQSELLKKLSEANEKSEEISDLRNYKKQLEEAIIKNELCFILENWVPMTIDEMKEELSILNTKLNTLI